MKKLIFLPALLCTLLGCQPKTAEKEADTKFLVTSVLQVDTSTVQQYVCQIRAISHIELRAQEKGYLQKIFIDEGQYVREGQPLFQVMPNLYQAETQKAEAEVNFADIEFQNTKRLADSNVVAPNELAMSRAKLNKAKAELSLAQVHLQFTQIRAPFSGIIDRFQVRLGSLLNDGDLITTLSDNSQMWVYFNVPESEYLDYRANTRSDSAMKVQLLMANNQLFPYPGVVRAVEADFNNETGNIAFRATFPNPKGLLRHGETGNILVQRSLPGALLIPQKATFEILDKKYVYVMAADGKINAREIKVAADMEDLFAISSGLKPGERILVEGIRKVKENDKIAYRFEEPRQVMSKLKLMAE